MDEFVSLLKMLKKNDKIIQNVLFMISESFRHNESEIGEALIKYYRSSFNKEPILDFLFILCSKDTKYLNFFKAYRKEFIRIDHKLVGLLMDGDENKPEGDQDVKKIKLGDKDSPVLEEISLGEMIEPEIDIKSDRVSSNDVKNKEYIGSIKYSTDINTKDENNSGVYKTSDMDVPVSGVFQEALSKNSTIKNNINLHVLNNDYLRLFANASILYPPNQCKLCGLRFDNTTCGNDEMGVHIDEHRRKVRVLSEKDCISREFFPTLEAWTKNIEKMKLNLKVEKVEKIVHSGGPTSCSICHSKIEVEWDDNEDNWILKDAVSLEKAGEATFCHRKCVV